MATSIELTLIVGLVIILYGFLSRVRKQKYKLPKGPVGIPLLGNVFQLTKNSHLKFSEWAQQYGKVYSINVAGTPALVINDTKTMKEIFGTMPSTGKYRFELFENILGGNVGLLNSEGNVYIEQKKFCIANLKQFGFGGGVQLDPLMLNEADNLFSWLDKEIKQDIPESEQIIIGKALLSATGNTIWNMITGEYNKIGESKILHCLEQSTELFVQCTNSGLVFLPWLRYIMPEKSGYNRYMLLTTKLRNYVQEYIDEHKNARKLAGPAPTVRDMIDVYLEEIENCTDPNSEFYGERGMQNLLYSAIGLLMAGAETTANSLNWLIFYMVAYPEIQEKLHEEIDSVLGSDRSPSIGDKKKLPFVEAAVLETLRKSSFVPYGLPHMLMEDLKYEDYQLPKGMILVANIYYANHDTKKWGDPENFRPERFLEGSEEHKKILRDSLAAFQEGKRKCPGEYMAKDTMFLFAAKLVQRYSFHPAEGRNRAEYTEPVPGFTLIPPKIGLVIKPRTVPILI